MRFLMRLARRVFPLSMFILAATLTLAQSARVKVVAEGRGQDNGSAKNEVIAKGRIVFGESCIQCHNMTTVLLQRKPVQGWRDTVYSMISRGAQLTPDEIEPLVAYLTATYGLDSPPPPHGNSTSGATADVGGAESLPNGPGKQILSRACATCHSLSLVTASRKSQAEWAKTLDRMASFGVALPPADRQTLTQYLAKSFGKKENE